jgi:hypothetical protein
MLTTFLAALLEVYDLQKDLKMEKNKMKEFIDLDH